MGRMSDVHIGATQDGVDLDDQAAVAKWIAEYMSSNDYLKEHLDQEKKVLKKIPENNKSVI